jgi:hypothetical protein
VRKLSLLFLLAFSHASSSVAANGVTAFSSYDLIELKIEAPLRELIAKARENENYAVTGKLTVVDGSGARGSEAIDVKISTRGHTSKQTDECEFPKLKITFPHGNGGPAFAGMKAVKLGTHCGERGDDELTQKFGRLANQKEPHREALAYRVLEAIAVPTLHARPARVAYLFTDDDGAGGPLVRNALLLEDDDQAAQRYSAKAQLTEDRFESAQSTMAPPDVARLAFAEAMLGNFDWCLRFEPGDHYRCDDRHPLWNMLALVRDSGPALPVIYDFDLSGFVVPRHIWFTQAFSEEFLPSRSRLEVEVLSQLQRTRSLFPRELLDATRKHFLDRKGDAFRAVHEAVVDDAGRQLAQGYLTAFYQFLGDDEFYRPVVIANGARAFLDVAQTCPACGASSQVPVGTVVGEPLERNGTLVKVRLLDVLWEWAPPTECKTIHQQPVWIRADAIGSRYPD